MHGTFWWVVKAGVKSGCDCSVALWEDSSTPWAGYEWQKEGRKGGGGGAGRGAYVLSGHKVLIVQGAAAKRLLELHAALWLEPLGRCCVACTV